MVELKGPGYTSSYNNILIIIPAIIIVALIGFVAYRLVDNLKSKNKKKEKARAKQQKKLDKQASPQASPAKNKKK